MITLALDSTSRYSSVALTDNDRILGHTFLDSGNTHSETLLPAIIDLLNFNHMHSDDVRLFACSAGPGSFTGVRIGVSILKGLCSGSTRPCVGVSTLEALAENLPYTDSLLCPVMDARRNQVYNALFRRTEEGLIRLTPDRLITLSELSAELSNYNQKIYLCGDGYSLAKKNLSVYTENTPSLLIAQNAVSVALVAKRQWENSPGSDFSEGKLQPIYLRASQAERERLEKETANKKI
ncbi:MAG: tRNA (adenosine(37)-N6)-threonylcarbamoyltransferase complex dimerization subunit type 1 TsaB [Ruminococcaceae bacterium]|nr:tRNA (adenosine(37)-N6)-threonylcarbamoyltransferase complex dimerization subunit type 1 TsaB [Oscillospiraceae bacterium]